MSDKPNAKPHHRRDAKHRDWREFLTSTERVEVEALEKNAQDLDAKRKALSQAIFAHRSRCVSRRRDWELRQQRAERAA